MTPPEPAPRAPSAPPAPGWREVGARSLGRDLAPAAVVAGVIALAATVPVPAPSGSSGWVGTAVHVGLYFCLCAALLVPWRTRGWPMPRLGPVTATVAYGALHELWQSVLPHRTAALGDLVADGAGALLAVLVLTLTRRSARP